MLRLFYLSWVLLLYPYLLHNDEVSKAEKYLGITETNNRNFSDKSFEAKLRKLGWREGLNWCAFFVGLILNETNNQNIIIRSGLARHYITRRSIPARRVLMGYKIKRNSLIIWQRGSSIFGHIGFVRKQVGKNKFDTIEGNVENAVRNKTRKIEIMKYFRITHFTEL